MDTCDDLGAPPMGYESKLIIAEACSVMPSKGAWLDVVMTVDLCKMGSGHFMRLVSASRTQRTDTRRFYYIAEHAGDDADPYVYEDLYGDALLPLDLDDTIKALEQDDTEGYRRMPPAIAALRAFRDHAEQWRDLVVLHYGH